jgi:hypothetical protein
MNAYAFAKKTKLNLKNCNKYLGNFTIKTQCCPYIKKHRGNCCCNAEKNISFSPCERIKKDFIDVSPSCSRRLLVLHVNLKNICPGKKIVVCVLIYENNKLCALKIKKINTDWFHTCKCRDFYVGKFCFAFKEEELCRYRKFKVKVLTHYVKS